MLALLLACVQTAPPLDLPADTGGASTQSCGTALVDSWPADGARDAWLWPELGVELDPPDPSAGLTLVSEAGGEAKASAAVVEEGAAWSLVLDDALSEGTAYTMVVDTCAGEEQVTFTTVADPGLPGGAATYQLDLGAGRVVSPAGLDQALAPLLPADPWLLGASVEGDQVALVVAMASGQAQDTCVVTQDLPAGFLDQAHFRGGPALATLDLQAGPVTLYDLAFSGTFVDDGQGIAGLELAALLDARDLAGLGTLGDTAEAVCELLARDGVSCEDCGDRVEACVRARWDSVAAPAVAGLLVEPITSPDCHPACAASWSNPLCNTAGW